MSRSRDMTPSMSWVPWFGLLLAVTSCGAQIFPFSNLKHIFDQRGKHAATSTSPAQTVEATTTAPSTTMTTEAATTTGLPAYHGPYSLLDDDDGYREFERHPDLTVARLRPRIRVPRPRPTSAAEPAPAPPAPPPPTRASSSPQHKAKQQQGFQPKHSKPLWPSQPAPGKHKKRLSLDAHPQPGRTGLAARPSHLVPIKIAAAESAAAASVALGPGHRTPGNHRAVPRPLPPPPPPLQHRPPSRAAKYKNHKSGHPLGPGPPKPVKYHNHRPGAPGLDEEESMTSLRYKKRPLGPIEQEVAQTGLQHTGHYPSSGSGDRVEFQMHGLHGPESYKFGYDTGGSHNRQFRYEERDPHGNVKGHYGYVDEHGQLQVVNYKADSHSGYSADVSKLRT